MLSARTKTGKVVSLGYRYKKETLDYLQKTEKFFCPVCGEALVLKLGERRIYHFAHKRGSVCSKSNENETPYHMEGKLQLFRWLRKHRFEAVLEYYDQEMKQRPDILYYQSKQKIALEYQCSSLPIEVFIKRNRQYVEHNYHPIWILGDNKLEYIHNNDVSLTDFHYMFLQETSNHHLYLPFFNPETGTLIFLTSIFPYAKKYAQAQSTILSLQDTAPPRILEPSVPVQKVFHNPTWKSKLDKYQWNWLMHPSKEQKGFARELYAKGLNPYLLPAEIGLPTPTSLLIKTIPGVWQTYVYLDILHQKTPGEWISSKVIRERFRQRIKRGDIQVRQTPLINEHQPLSAIFEYLELLSALGIIKSQGKETYQIQRPLLIPKSNREKEQFSTSFLQKLTRISVKR